MTTLTGQNEQNSFRIRQLEEQLAKFRGDAEFRLNTLEGKPGAPAASATPPNPFTPPGKSPPAPPPAPAANADPAEPASSSAYALVDQHRRSNANAAVQYVVPKLPKHKRARH